MRKTNFRYLMRTGTEADLPALQALLENYQMEVDVNPDEFLLAEIDGELVGAARLENEADQVYLRPIVIDSQWRGKNIGRALIRRIAGEVDNLYVVARGESIGFYHKLGFLPIPWEQVPERYWQECDACPDLAECRPKPMVMTDPKDA